MPLDIIEYQRLAADANGREIMAGQEPRVARQQLAVGGSAVASQPFTDTTRFVRLHSDVPCRVEFGATPTADAQSMRLAAGVTEFFGVAPGLRLSVITTT